MSDTIILRVVSTAGRSRVEMKVNQTLFDFKQELSGRLGIPTNQIALFTDQALKKKVSARDTSSLAKCGFKNGDMLHVGNQNAVLTSVATAATQAKPAEGGAKMIDTSGGTSGKPQAAAAATGTTRTSRCNHPTSSKCVHCMSSAK